MPGPAQDITGLAPQGSGRGKPLGDMIAALREKNPLLTNREALKQLRQTDAIVSATVAEDRRRGWYGTHTGGELRRVHSKPQGSNPWIAAEKRNTDVYAQPTTRLRM